MRQVPILLGLLMLANVAVFLWPTEADTAPHVHSARAEVNPHFVRLNKEIEDRFYADSKNRQATVSSPPPQGRLVGNATLAQVGGDSDCYRLGPFAHRANYELAQAVLFNAGVNFAKSSRESKESNVYRVYLGPYATSALVKDARVVLKRQNILDHFIRKESDDNYIISLGIYTTQESADRAIELFADKLDEVKLKDERVVLPETHWLHFSLTEKDRVRQELVRLDWGEKSAKMGKHECQVEESV